MRNVDLAVKGTILTITVDLSKAGTESTSGKSLTIGSTHGNAAVADSQGNQYKVGVNVYQPK